jgi:hypothetical protein
MITDALNQTDLSHVSEVLTSSRVDPVRFLILSHVAAGELVTNSCHIHNYANMIGFDLFSDLWDPSRCKWAMWENRNGSSRASDKLVHVGRTSWDISMLKCDSPGARFNSWDMTWWSSSAKHVLNLVRPWFENTGQTDSRSSTHEHIRRGIGWKLEDTVIIATVFTDLPELIVTWFQL